MKVIFNTLSTELCRLILHNVHNESSQLILKNLISHIKKKTMLFKIYLNNLFKNLQSFS